MQFALLVYESPEAFKARNGSETDPYLRAWRAYHKALVEAGVYVGGNPLEVPETGTTVRLKDGKRRVQDGPYDTKEQLGGFSARARMDSTHLLRERVTIRSEGRGLLRNTGTTFSIQSLSMRLDPRRRCASSSMPLRCRQRGCHLKS